MSRFKRSFGAIVVFLATFAISCTEAGISPVDPLINPPDPPPAKVDTIFVSFYAARPTGSTSLPWSGNISIWVNGRLESFFLPISGKISITGNIVKEAYNRGSLDSILVEIPGFKSIFTQSVLKDTFRDVSGVLLEENWRIDQGAFAGQSVNLSLIEAYTESGGTGQFLPFYKRTLSQRSGPTAKWSYYLRFVPEDSFPLPFVILLDTAEAEGIEVTSADATVIQNASNMVEEALGRDVLQPVRLGYSYQWNNCNAVVVILVKIPAADGLPGWCGSTTTPSSAITGGAIVLGINWIRGASNDPGGLAVGTTAHEFIHTLGFGHSVWPSLMQSAGGHREGFNAKLVAYMEAYQRVRNLQWKYNALFGLPEMHQAERRAMGLPVEQYFASYR